jgi:hypothetical protein
MKIVIYILSPNGTTRLMMKHLAAALAESATVELCPVTRPLLPWMNSPISSASPAPSTTCGSLPS